MWNYISGFLKINNQNRFAPDISDAEATKFTRTYRSIAQIDRQRVEYLYPRVIEPARFQQYLAEFEGLLRSAKEHGAKVVVVKPPTPARYRDKLPKEAEFDATIRPLLEANGVPFHDLSTALTEDRYFYDTDHLKSHRRDGLHRRAARWAAAPISVSVRRLWPRRRGNAKAVTRLLRSTRAGSCRCRSRRQPRRAVSAMRRGREEGFDEIIKRFPCASFDIGRIGAARDFDMACHRLSEHRADRRSRSTARSRSRAGKFPARAA